MGKKKKIKAVMVVGARPNFIKAAPILRTMKKSDRFSPILLHTGQHYDDKMSGEFFKELELPKPDIFLGVGSDTISKQMAEIMVLCEEHFLKIKPDLVLVVGDVTSTLAAALAAKRLDIPVAHVEAGLRSFDRKMPEEINRVLTDHISDYLFTTEESGNLNLKKEGIDPRKIFFVGNTMIDTLLSSKEKISKSKIIEEFGVRSKNYIVLTLHRPSNVDDKLSFKRILDALLKIQRDLPIVFPVHPRTKKQIERMNLGKELKKAKNLILTEPMGYLAFMQLVSQSKYVLTDSGGIQEEATVLGIPCVTLRENTERPVTVYQGTNFVIGTDPKNIYRTHKKILSGKTKKGHSPKYWDGKASERLVSIYLKTKDCY